MSTPAERLDFAEAARTLSASKLNTRERRRFRRAPLVVAGRMLDPFGREHDCRTADISPGDVRIAAPILPEVGQKVVLYLEGFGRVSGSVARRCGEEEVAIIFDQSAHKREKMAEALTLAINKSILGDESQPMEKRSSTAHVQFETGESFEGEVLDFSLAGMTIRSTKISPPIGAWVRIGNTYGRVARRIENGFAIDFETPRK